uniref:hypothetical protein n=1 Tax=Methylophilus sp. TaxID=29541 RepID=UPI004036B08A
MCQNINPYKNQLDSGIFDLFACCRSSNCFAMCTALVRHEQCWRTASMVCPAVAASQGDAVSLTQGLVYIAVCAAEKCSDGRIMLKSRFIFISTET